MMDIRDEFFVIDSRRLNEVAESRMYGFAIDETGVFENGNYKLHAGPLPDCGCWVLVDVTTDEIAISQDANGSYRLYLFQAPDGYFAIGNSFFMLLDYVKRRYPLTFNRDYANQLLAANLCSLSYQETCVNEIRCIDRRAIVVLSKINGTYQERERNLDSNKIPVDSKEGIDILDKWFKKWTRILGAIQKNNPNFVANLSGGFDTRMVLPLLLGSKIDINKIQVFSTVSNSPVHQEDFKIAQMIADRFGFCLNTNVFHEPHLPYTFDEALELAFCTKMTFHKKMYFQPVCRTTKRFQVQGMGGELSRDYWGRFNIESLLRSNTAGLSKKLSKVLFEELKGSFHRTLVKSGKEACATNNVTYTEESAPNFIYSETRNRNHFGKAILENYFGGNYVLAPLLDPLLFQLSIDRAACHDPNLIVAFIFARYCPALFDFPVEGGRKISEEAHDYAMEICGRHQPVEDHVSAVAGNGFVIEPNVALAERLRNTRSAGREVSTAEIEQYLSDVICSPECKRRIVDCFGEEMYNLAVAGLGETGFVNQKDWHGILGLLVAYEDVKFSHAANCSSVKAYLDGLRRDAGFDVCETRTPLPSEKHPIVYSLKVKGGRLQVSGTLQSLEGKEEIKKAAIMLARFFDAEGNQCNSESLPISAMFKCGFSYLTCSEGTAPFTRLMQIPPAAVCAEICFARFLNNHMLVLSNVKFENFN